jgi:hypothetical protein
MRRQTTPATKPKRPMKSSSATWSRSGRFWCGLTLRKTNRSTAARPPVGLEILVRWTETTVVVVRGTYKLIKKHHLHETCSANTFFRQKKKGSARYKDRLCRQDKLTPPKSGPATLSGSRCQRIWKSQHGRVILPRNTNVAPIMPPYRPRLWNR